MNADYIQLDISLLKTNKNGNKCFKATDNCYLIIFGCHKLEIITYFGISHIEDARTFRSLGHPQTKIFMPLKKDSTAEIITDKIYAAYIAVKEK